MKKYILVLIAVFMSITVNASAITLKTQNNTPSKSIITSPANNAKVNANETLTLKWENYGATRKMVMIKAKVNGKTLTLKRIKNAQITSLDFVLPLEFTYAYAYILSYDKDDKFFGYSMVQFYPKSTLNNPISPSNLSATNVEQTKATLIWSDNSTNETGFKIYNDTTLIETVGANVITYNLTGLTANTEYSYTVKAYNSAGVSTAITTTFKTKDTVSLTPPHSLQINKSTLTSTSVKVLFEDTTLEETGFKIYDAATNEVLALIPSVPGKYNWAHQYLSVDDTTLKSLKPNTNYRIYITAYNATQESKKSRFYSFKTLNSIPNKPTNVSETNTTQTSTTIHFSDNSNNEDGFKIYDESGTLLKTVVANSTTATLENLEQDTNYSIYVVAYNNMGESESSNLLVFTTLPNKPNAPCSLNITKDSSTSVVVTFQDKALNEDGFRIYTESGELLKTIPSSASIGWIHSKLNKKLRTISNLSAGIPYKVYVVAYNAGGESEKTPITSFTIDGTLHAPSKIYIHKSAGATSAKITFKDTSLNESGYRIYSVDGQLLGTYEASPSVSQSAYNTLTGLTENTNYSVYMVSFDENGESEKSNTIHFKTEKDNHGKVPLLVIRVAYQDKGFINTEETWREKIFNATKEGNLNHYYNEISYGKMQYIPVRENKGTSNDGMVTVKLSVNHPPHYVKYSFQKYYEKESLTLADQYVDFSIYDTNNDGLLTNGEIEILYVVAGYYSHIHAAPSTKITVDGKKFKQSVAYIHEGNGIITINKHIKLGAMAHELGHASFHLPDLYGNPSKSYYAGLMAKGYIAHAGRKPTHMSAWSKIESGFIEPTVITKSTNNVKLYSSVTDNYTAIKIPIAPNEYFLVENKYSTKGYDTGLHSGSNYNGGILIWHIDDNLVSGPSRVFLEKADNRNIYSINSFFGQNGVDTFNELTLPNSNRNDGKPSGVSIENISQEGDMMTFDIIIDESVYYKNTL